MTHIRMKFGWCVVVLAAIALLFASPGATMAQGEDGDGDEGLEISLHDMSGRQVGTAVLMDSEAGLLVEASVAGMDPVAGDRATMFHEVGVCGTGDDFGADYGGIIQHLPNMQFYVNGSGSYEVAAADLTLADLMDGDGAAYVMHADAGEEFGPPIVCGVVPPGEEPAPEPEPEPEPAPDAEPAPEPEPEPEPETDPVDEADADGDGEITEEEYLHWLYTNGVTADLFNVNGNLVGFMEALFDFGEMAIGVYLEGMDPVGGNHRIVVAEQGACDAESFDVLYELPDIQLFASGVADYFQVVEGIDDASGILDEDGSTLLIYADTGDDPGDIIACGTIMSIPDYLDMYGLTVADYIEFIFELM